MESHFDQPANKPATRRSPSRRARIVGALIALIALGGLGGLAWYLTHPDAPAGGAAGAGAGGGPGGPGGGGRGGRGGAPTTVGVASAELADLPVMLDALGSVSAAATVTVRPQVAGVLKEVLYHEGQPVKAGQLLARIDPRPFELALQQASGQLQRDQAQLENARLSLQRFQTLLSQDSIARQDVDTQAALVKQLDGTVMIDRANESTARLNLSYTRIVAPISGRVGLRTVDAGNLVSTGDANGVALITQVSPIDVTFALPQDRVPELQARAGNGPAPSVTALDRNRSNVLDTGHFLALDNQVDVQTGTVRAKARFANEKLTLFPSQFVNVQLMLRTVKDAVMVPVTALRHGGSGDFVYVLNAAERTVALRPVTRGEATVDKVQIATGLKAGEKVITEGADRLKDGAKVTLPGDKPAFGGGGGGGRGKRGQRGDGAAAGSAAASGASASGPAAAGESGAASAHAWGGKKNAAGAADSESTPAAASGPGSAHGWGGKKAAGEAESASASGSASAAQGDASAPREHHRRAKEASAQ